MNWKNYFDKTRLERGQDYYNRGRVYDIVIEENSITSKVEGSSTYEVSIAYHDDVIDSMYCTCPYSYSTDYCKHMVATLLKMEEIEKSKKGVINSEDTLNNQFYNTLYDLSEIDLKNYIYDKFNQDTEFISSFLNEFQEESDTELIYWEAVDKLNNIFDMDIKELYNHSEFYEQTPLHQLLESFIEVDIRQLYKQEKYVEVQDLLYKIYETIATREDIDVYIRVDDILRACDSYLSMIIEVQERIEREEIFNYIINNIKYEYNKYTTHHLARIGITYYTSKDYQRQLEQLLDELIDKNSEISEDILLLKYELMKKMKYPINNQENYLLKYKTYPEIRKILVEKQIKDKNYQKAITLLEEKEETSIQDHEKLMQLYLKIDDIPQYKKQLKTILYKNIPEIKYIKQLKQVCSTEEWSEELEQIITNYTKTHHYEFLNEIYINEERYGDLYQNVIENCPLESIDKYKQYYENEHGQDILEIYKKLVLNEAKTAKHKGAYTLITTYIKRMLTYPNGEEIVKPLIMTLKNKNKQKKLFIEELEKIEETL
ncbi:SWIM zinc finger family protein [Methanosphaera sp.]